MTTVFDGEEDSREKIGRGNRSSNRSSCSDSSPLTGGSLRRPHPCLFSCLPQLPYTVGSRDDNTELFNLRINDAVKVLRDQYQADLVVLVGVFPAVCGRA